jgi:isopenicillin-N N-acyltransferase-like protein
MYRNVRYARLLRQSQQLDQPTIKTLISDHSSHPHSICAHADPEEPESAQIETRCSVLISLKNRTMHITDGTPCCHDYEEFSLAA